MPSPNAVFTELVTTTWRKHAKDLKDNLSKNNALLRRLDKKGMKRKEDGGLTIVQGLDYAANQTYQRYSGYDVLNVGASDVLTAAEYQWRQIAINVVASGRELRINSGDSRIINLAKARIKNAIRTFNNNFSSDLYSAGSLTNQINGLQAIIADTNTNTVGGIDASAWPFWQNTVISAATLSVTPSATTIENGLMLPAWLAVDRGPDDQPDLIVADNNYYQFFEGSQVSLKRYNDASKADAGFVTLKYKSADVLYDGNSGIPANHMYFVNSQYLQLVTHEAADFTQMDARTPVNQDGEVIPILWMGNLVCTNRSLQAVIVP